MAYPETIVATVSDMSLLQKIAALLLFLMPCAGVAQAEDQAYQEYTVCTHEHVDIPRVIEIKYPNGTHLPCRVFYYKNAHAKPQGQSNNTSGVCPAIRDKIVGNLVDGRFKCFPPLVLDANSGASFSDLISRFNGSEKRTANSSGIRAECISEAADGTVTVYFRSLSAAETTFTRGSVKEFSADYCPQFDQGQIAKSLTGVTITVSAFVKDNLAGEEEFQFMVLGTHSG